MKKIKTILCVTTCFFFLQSGFGQDILDNTKIFGGLAKMDQDRRLFYFPDAEGVVEREDSKIDWEANVYIQKRIFKLWKLSGWSGFGYSRFHTKFSRPFDHSYFTGEFTQELRHIGSYSIYKFIIPTALQFSFFKNNALFINLTCIPAFDFNKKIKGSYGGWKFNKWKPEFFGVEVNPGIGGKIGRVTLLLNYRYLNIVKLDRVIFNELLFYLKNPPFLDKTYDNYNPGKVGLTIGYDIYRHD